MKTIIVILIGLFFFSCDDKFSGYLATGDNVYMKLLSFDEEVKDTTVGTYASVKIEIKDKEQLLYKHYKEDLICLDSNKFKFLIQYLNQGDSCLFKVPSKKIIEDIVLFKSNQTISEYIDVSIKVCRYFNEDQYYKESQNFDPEILEQVILREYLKEVDAKPYRGIFVKQLKQGKGKEIENGDKVTIAYKGYFANRLEFDQISGSTAFTFRYGTSGQVIEGLNIAINGMKKAEKSKIIISSQLAFGEEGSTTLVVPPFTTVIYELEILNVK